MKGHKKKKVQARRGEIPDLYEGERVDLEVEVVVTECGSFEGGVQWTFHIEEHVTVFRVTARGRGGEAAVYCESGWR